MSPLRFIKLCYLILLFNSLAIAGPINKEEATRAVEGWLELRNAPLGEAMPATITQSIAYPDNTGEPLFFAMILEPAGFVVASADDRMEPILCFSATGEWSADSPLRTLLADDLQNRRNTLRNLQSTSSAGLRHDSKDSPLTQSITAAQARWREFTSASFEPDYVKLSYRETLSEAYVAPLIQSRWGQTTVADEPAYNYYVPNHYPTGCAATAMAQLLRYHEYPKTGIGVREFPITIDYQHRTAATLGGDEAGGPYAWDRMPLVPDESITREERKAIGALLYDAGISLQMQFEPTGSAAESQPIARSLKRFFNYANGIYYHAEYNKVSLSSDVYSHILRTNLEAGYPVILGIHQELGGHAVVCDGYGKDGDEVYHHMNMGWSGLEDFWYALPQIGDYNRLTTMVYNLFPEKTGEILMGSVKDAEGRPLEGITVRAGNITGTTNARGVYALAGLAAGEYSVSVAKPGWTPQAQKIQLSASRDFFTFHNTDNVQVSGNLDGVDFTLQPREENPSPPAELTIEGPETIDEHNSAKFSCKADGETVAVSWGVYSNSDATIDNSGLLTVQDIQSERETGVFAVFEGQLVEKQIHLQPVPSELQYSGGNGTADDPFQLATKDDLLNLAENPDDYDKYFELTADIDLEPEIFSTALIAPDGLRPIPFSGVIDGNDHTIANLTISTKGPDTDFLGLIGRLEGTQAGIFDLSLINLEITAGDDADYVGGLAGWVSDAVLEDCHVQGHITGGNFADFYGGLCGFFDGGSMRECDVDITITTADSCEMHGGLFGFGQHVLIEDSKAHIELISANQASDHGGLVGRLFFGTLQNSSAKGTITVGDDSTHIAGLNGVLNFALLQDCTSNVNVTGGNYNNGVAGCAGDLDTSRVFNSSHSGNISVEDHSENVGGFVGYSKNPQIEDCVAIGDVRTGKSPLAVGGFCGTLEGLTLTRNFASGTVQAGAQGQYIGGFVGGVRSGTIEQSYATAAVTAENDFQFIGGFAGGNAGTLSNCYADGQVSGGDNSTYIGGFCGGNQGIITKSYASTSVHCGDGATLLGAFCGVNQGQPIGDCFFDEELALISDNMGAVAMTTEQMQTTTPFLNAGWDMESVWEMDGYPRIRTIAQFATIFGHLPGWLNFSMMGWIADYHMIRPDEGWLYRYSNAQWYWLSRGSSPENLFLWSANESKWLWTCQAYFPWKYDYTSTQWGWF